MWIGSFSKISGCRNTGYGSILLPGETWTLFWQTALIPASSSFLSLILEGQSWTKVWSKSVWLGSKGGAQWRSWWKNRHVRFPLSILEGSSPYPCTEKSRFSPQPCFLFQLKTNQHRRYLRLRHSQLWARCHLSFRCPTVWQAGTVFAPTRQPVQALASILRSVNASVTNLILYRSIWMMVFAPFVSTCKQCQVRHFKGVVTLSPAENLCGRSCWRGYRGVGGVE